MHIADRLKLPAGYAARPYRGRDDHPAMAAILADYREHHGDPDMPTVEQMDVSYANLKDCDPDTDIAIVEHDGHPIAYTRVYREDLDAGTLDCVLFAPTRHLHVTTELYGSLLTGMEAHTRHWAEGADAARYRAFAVHPGPGRPPTGRGAAASAP